MDRTWTIEIRIKMGGEEQDYFVGAGYIPSGNFPAEGSKAHEKAIGIIFERVLAAARAAIYDFSNDDRSQKRSTLGPDMESRPFSD